MANLFFGAAVVMGPFAAVNALTQTTRIVSLGTPRLALTPAR